MGYLPPFPRPEWPPLAPLPREELFYPTPDPAGWTDAHRRRHYRRQRIDRHRRYLHCLSWSRSLLGADIRARLDRARSNAESAWLLDEELGRRFQHRRPLYGLCDCQMRDYVGNHHWWPFPEDQWEPEPAPVLMNLNR